MREISKECEMTEMPSETVPTSETKPEPRARGKRSAEDAIATREAILKAALKLFAGKGFDGTSLRDIAAEAGISHGIIRHHFGSKMVIWETVAGTVFDYFRESLLSWANLANEDANTTDNAKPLDAFRNLVSRFIQISLDAPEYARLFVQETRQESERSRFCAERFVDLHLAIGELFNRAQQSSSCLDKYTNDSFFYALMSLTYFKILHPTLGSPNITAATDVENTFMHDFILSVLFAHAD